MRLLATGIETGTKQTSMWRILTYQNETYSYLHENFQKVLPTTSFLLLSASPPFQSVTLPSSRVGVPPSFAHRIPPREVARLRTPDQRSEHRQNGQEDRRRYRLGDHLLLRGGLPARQGRDHRQRPGKQVQIVIFNSGT